MATNTLIESLNNILQNAFVTNVVRMADHYLVTYVKDGHTQEVNLPFEHGHSNLMQTAVNLID